jgi:hypothetical protein
VRKTIITSATVHSGPHTEREWLDLEQIAKVEFTSENPSFPIESALVAEKEPGWKRLRVVSKLSV